MHDTEKNSHSQNSQPPYGQGIFGLSYPIEAAKLVYLPVPWEVTTSYGSGTRNGPTAILNASHQIDLHDPEVQTPYRAGLHLLPESQEIHAWNTEGKLFAQKVVATVPEGDPLHLYPEPLGWIESVNQLSERLNDLIYNETLDQLHSGRIVGILGGDHSVPFGAIRAAAESLFKKDFGILHIDAHFDLRKAYQGFTHSHASIMYNVLEKIPQVTKLVQVGIRDFCEEEMEYAKSQKDRTVPYLDAELTQRKFRGEFWAQVSKEIVANLPENVWVSFDIDGLDPRFCPHTGTPVPGGLDFNEALYLIGELARSGRKIVGFDLCEVSPSPENGDPAQQAPSDPHREWDANVGMRVLYKLSAWTLASQGLAGITPLKSTECSSSERRSN